MPKRAADQVLRDAEAVGSRTATAATAATAPRAVRRQRASLHEVEPSYV